MGSHQHYANLNPFNCGCEDPYKKEDKCIPPQIDATHIFYKLEGNGVSNLSGLAIPKGANLEDIIEIFGDRFKKYTDVNNIQIDEYPEATSVQEFVAIILGEIRILKDRVTELEAQLEE